MIIAITFTSIINQTLSFIKQYYWYIQPADRKYSLEKCYLNYVSKLSNSLIQISCVHQQHSVTWNINAQINFGTIKQYSALRTSERLDKQINSITFHKRKNNFQIEILVIHQNFSPLWVNLLFVSDQSLCHRGNKVYKYDGFTFWKCLFSSKFTTISNVQLNLSLRGNI